MLCKYFRLTKDVWQREFNSFAWQTNQGMMHHPRFFRGMHPNDFQMIALKKDYKNPETEATNNKKAYGVIVKKKSENDLITKKRKREKAAKKASKEARKMKEKKMKK